ncbi:uncharacterized protein LOC108105965 isoform X1 [Drosophila eugracilis]|uniref:uncharacterized protein LOC108105965 isoform X1 n=1 Tax=Drosophila eugracilis TaxID=29029 RepID=UPI0007E84072|nr:uncharacterized protein LOC108105965 isoform X1 [Drosophila eugracilis]XP_041674214.1 uncharacterized protein LOC108105965 isoform X1 [Drosophila eugracilis]
MAKLTLPCLLRRLQLVALQLQLQLQPQQQQQQQQLQQHPHGSHLMAMQLGQAVLLYGCLLLLHASVSASVLASSSDSSAIPASLVNISVAVDLNGIPTQQEELKLNEKRTRKRDAANVPDDDEYGSYPDDVDDLEALLNNKSAKGKYIGAPCNELKCDVKLLHVSCDKESQTCSCERNYPVQLGLIKGCAKPKKLGDQCFYDETCIYNDENSLCVQVRHNAMCQCASGFHSVSYVKPTRRVFCTPDLSELSSDLPTLLGVSTGIAVLAGLICMVLHLFSKTKYPRHRNYGDASIPPPILYSSDTGIPLTVHSARPSSRSSIRSTGSIGSYGNRRASAGGLGGAAGGGMTGGAGGGGASGSGGSKGILVSTSRTGAARSAAILLISCHIAAVSKQNSRSSSRHTSGAGCSQHSRDDLDDGGGGGGGGGGSGSGCRSCESTLSMNRHLQKQLNHQRHLLSFELSPARSRNQDRFRTLLGMNGIDNFGGNEDVDDECGPHSIDPSTTVPHAHANAHVHGHGHDSDPADPGGEGGVGGVGVGVGFSYSYGYSYGYAGVAGGYGDADTNGGDSSGGYATGAELHHLQIGALPTPASETPRFAVLEDQV